MASNELGTYWASQPRWNPFAPPEPEPEPVAQWCHESEQFAQWAAEFVEMVRNDRSLTRDKLTFALGELLDHYYGWQNVAGPDHRVENNLDNHPCLYKVLITAYKQLQKCYLSRGLRPFEPPESIILEGRVQGQVETKLDDPLADFDAGIDETSGPLGTFVDE